MSQNNPSPDNQAPDVLIEHSRGLPLVWLLPVAALLVGGWLAYDYYKDRGPIITITFESAAGLEPGKTKVKYRDVTLGMVTDVALSEDLSHVVVSAEMERSAAEHLREGTVFWVENARVTAAGVSGLSTLVSGAYVGVKPGEGPPSSTFKGREHPPVLQVTVPGTQYTLHSQTSGSVSASSPIFYRGVQVGEVLGSKLAKNADEVELIAFVRAPYDELVKPETRFWNASGIDVSMSAKGLKVRTESVVSVLVGGIAFETPVVAHPNQPSPDGADFHLHDSYDQISEAVYTERVRYLLYFTGSVSGLEPGSPVTFYGLPIGVVKSVQLEIDAADYSVRVPVVIEIEPERTLVVGASSDKPYQRMKALVSKGLRAQLRSASLLTGTLGVALDFFPNEPINQLVSQDDYYVIPTVPSTIEQLTEKATVFLDKLAGAPMADLIVDLRNTVASVDSLLKSESLQEGFDALEELKPLLRSFKETSDSARATLESASNVVGDDSALRHDMVQMIEELTDMARSVGALTEFIERNPNALIFGKPESGDR